MKKIFDVVRKKFVAHSPEEEVRQKVILFLIQEKKFPLSLLSVERRINKNENVKNLRTDIIVYKNDCITPLILVECKSEKVNINRRNIDQLIEYNFFVKAHYILLTNGKNFFCFEDEGGKYIPSMLPLYDELCS